MPMVVRLSLSAVFLTAGVTQLLDRAGTVQALRDVGAPQWWVRPVGALLPAVELCIGVLLLPIATAWWGAVGALTLLVGFVVAIAANLARGRTRAPRRAASITISSRGLGSPMGLLCVSPQYLWSQSTTNRHLFARLTL